MQSRVSLILLGAGKSTRFGLSTIKKQWIRVGDDPLFMYVYHQFISNFEFDKIVITVDELDLNYIKSNFCNDKITFVAGSTSRSKSIQKAISCIDSEYVLISDIARCNIDTKVVSNILSEIESNIDCVVPYLSVSDTVVYANSTINRDEVKLIQTPQLSRLSMLKKVIHLENTDERGALESIGAKISYIEGSNKLNKLTFANDLNDIKLPIPSLKTFVGHGYDIHRTKDGSSIVLCGIDIPAPFGLDAHSDGDVAIHALIDALLGSIGASDIGELFPDTDDKYSGISSVLLLKKVVIFIYSLGFIINNIDISILAQSPKLQNYKQSMKENIASVLKISLSNINIKATTMEKLGDIGQHKAIAVHSVVSLSYFQWQNAKS